MKVVPAHGYVHHFFAVLVRLQTDRAVVHLDPVRIVKALALLAIRLLLKLFNDARGLFVLYILLTLQTSDAAGTEASVACEPAIAVDFPIPPSMLILPIALRPALKILAQTIHAMSAQLHHANAHYYRKDEHHEGSLILDHVVLDNVFPDDYSKCSPLRILKILDEYFDLHA